MHITLNEKKKKIICIFNKEKSNDRVDGRVLSI